MLSLPYFTQRKKMDNPIVEAVDVLVNLDSIGIKMQQPDDSKEQSYRWLVVLTRVDYMKPLSRQYSCYHFFRHFASII